MESTHHSEGNRRIIKDLSERVFGHETAKKVLINLVNRSKLRYYQKHGLMMDTDDLVPLTNCLLIGDSGTGKTHLVESLAEVMEFPLLKINATTLNPTGAAGGIKVSDFMKKITKRAQDYLETFPETYWSLEGTIDQMVVFVDEVDKLGLHLSSDWNKDVQANFLSLFEGKTGLDGVSFIFAGAFTGIDKHAKVVKKIGFSHHKDDEVLTLDLVQEIIKFGLMPEFVGRLNNVVQLEKLTKESYSHILKNLILPKSTALLQNYGISDYQMPEKDIDKLAEEATKSGLGVRTLHSGVNRVLTDIEFDPEEYVNEVSK